MSDPEAQWLWAVHQHYREQLPMWVVYRPTTRDFPGEWVMRMHLTLPQPKPTSVLIVADTLEAARERLPPGLVMLARDPGDDPTIEEVWL